MEAKEKSTVPSKSEKIATVSEQVITEESITAVNNTVEIIKEEYGDFKLTRKMRKELAKEIGADEETANGWQTVSDILDRIDTVELAKKHPEAIAGIAKTATTIIGFFVGPVGTIGNALPEKYVAKAVELAGMATPEHILNVIAKKQVERKKKVLKKAKEKSDEMTK